MQGLLNNLDLPPMGVIFVIMGILIILGTFMEWIAIAYITVPIFAPVVVGLGFDPIWFGVLFVINIQIYFLSPPFGPACFWLKSVAPPEITLQQIFWAVLPLHRPADHRSGAGDAVPARSCCSCRRHWGARA